MISELPSSKGSFENGDVPARIRQLFKAREGEIICYVEWRKRVDGVVPDASTCFTSAMKERFPQMLMDYYLSVLQMRIGCKR